MLKKITLVISTLLLVSVISGCDFLYSLLDNAYELRGIWVLDHDETTPDQAEYYEFIVNGDDTYEIVDFDSVTIEKGVMSNVTSDSFDYVISVQTLYPDIIGSTSYAKWSVTNDKLSISFYDNATMNTLWVTFVCTRP